MINDITITSLDTIKVFGMDGTYRFTLDELQNAKIANTQDKSDITGKGGRKLSSLKKNKAVTVSATNGLISGGLMELQTGSKFEDKDDAPVKWSEYLTVEKNATTVNTTYKAVGTEGNEIEKIYIKDADGRVEKTLIQDSTATKDASFAYAPASKTITFAEGQFSENTEIIVHYLREVKGYVLNNNSEVYSEKGQIYIDGTGEDICNNIYRIQFYCPRADFEGNFDFDLGGDQTVHSFEAESLAGSCGLGGNLWTYTVFGVNEGDAA